MKRVIVAVLLLCGIVVACLLSLWMQNAVLDEFMARTREMEALFDDGHIALATEAAARFAEDYRKQTRIFALFLPHSMLTEVEKSVVSLPAILTHGEHKDFTAEVRRCRMLLEKMHDLEIPTLQNVF